MKKYKKTIGLLVFIFFLMYFFSSFPVNALTQEELEFEKKVVPCLTGKALDYGNAYQISFSNSGNGIYVMSMSLDDNALIAFPKLKDNVPTFKVEYIGIENVSNIGRAIVPYSQYLNSGYYANIDQTQRLGLYGRTLSLNNNLTFSVPNITNNQLVRVYIVLRSVEDDEIFSDLCGFEKGPSIIYYTLDVYPSSNTGVVNVSRDKIFNPGEIIYSEGVDCGELDDNYLPKTDVYKTKYNSKSFEYKYCEAAYKAKTKNTTQIRDFSIHHTESGKKGYRTFTNELITYDSYITNGGQPITKFTCDPFSAIPAPTGSDDYYRELNRSYLVGNVVQSVQVGEYIYNFGGQNPTTGISIDEQYRVVEDIMCNVNCHEVVTVEYGPPVATTAGMCFEYNVKVTSRVSCSSSLSGPPNPPTIEYCNPSEHCWSPPPPPSSDGPNEDFDACILDCDGGSYSASCSRTCYDEVYNQKKTFANVTSRNVDEFIEKLNIRRNDSLCSKKGSCYFYVDVKQPRSQIQWKVFGTVGGAARGRENLSSPCIKDSLNGGGIPCACSCSLLCRWTLPNCPGGYYNYLNPGEWDRDNSPVKIPETNEKGRNIIAYEAATQECKKFSRCSTQIAEFSIDVLYNYKENGKKKDTVIHLPYSNNNQKTDKITHSKDDVITCDKDSNATTIISSDGCYLCPGETSINGKDSAFNRLYQTEWGLQHSWIRIKTGEISYQPMMSDTWVERDFCIPFDAMNVNQKWWNYHFLKQAEEKGIKFSFDDPTYTENIEGCAITSCKKSEEIKEDSDKMVDEWNIQAHAKKFGLFAWNIDVDCFYALNDSFPYNENGDSVCTTTGTECNVDRTKEPYVIRSVDISKANESSDKTAKLFPSKGESGGSRSPGYNWSQFAIVGKDKDENYLSNPVKYSKWMVNIGYDVYSDEYLDYYVKLTKDNINKLKGDKDYTNYCAGDGDSDRCFTVSSVVNYRSPLFEEGSTLLSGDKLYPDSRTLRCNNIGKKTSNARVGSYTADCFDVEKEVSDNE